MKIEYKRNINKEVIMREEVFDYLMSMYHNYKKQKEVLDKIKEYIAMVEHCALVDKKIIFSMRTLKDILEEII